MPKNLPNILIILILFLLLTGCDRLFPAYDEQADAEKDISEALALAKQENKLVLLDFGANWCHDCRALSKKMKSTSINELIQQHFIVVMINTGDWDSNMDIADRYKSTVQSGIPAIVVLNQNNQPLYKASADLLSKTHRNGNDSLYRFFNQIVKNYRI
jgi:thioredoxin